MILYLGDEDIQYQLCTDLMIQFLKYRIFVKQSNYVPMFTFGDPDIITFGTLASIIVSPTLVAGLLFINTVLLPI
jgi:hypothetical protein